jgi:hypothetical protein
MIIAIVTASACGGMRAARGAPEITEQHGADAHRHREAPVDRPAALKKPGAEQSGE